MRGIDWAGQAATIAAGFAMTQKMFRAPTDLERSFLRLVVRGYKEIEEQIEHCLIAEYDPAGWCDVQIVAGPPSPVRFHAQGPTIKLGDPERPQLYVDTSLSVSETGMLQSVEIVRYAGDVRSPYRLFVEADRNNELQYPEQRDNR